MNTFILGRLLTSLAMASGAAALLATGTVVAQTYDLLINTDQDSTVELKKPGNSVLVDRDISIAPSRGNGITGLAGDDWRITNRGSINSGSGGKAIELDGPNASVINEHRIRGDMAGINGRAGLHLLNAQNAIISGNSAVTGSGQLNLDNSGTIKGTLQGINFDLPSSGTGATLINRGLVEGGYLGVRLYSSADSTATNSIRNLAGGSCWVPG
ncbi:hypothetical protein M5C90_24800 [Pseudomonas chlororaphis subsp. piscium]|uniref:hypothetical protein n=1 Tax=Pseudomonas chlororaphis TaxID=587753 RepID=UPI000F565F43|nr:hypothetical protein [Pseudomonas chlororaphis]AZD86975.1 hypothetical protein C4K14_4153 [Pseudomonas chlororaphis subsp. aureofaciens]UQS88776.1 hypothetical protein M5C90_24800 [Pseudomonas chlororaphis subsp. piscium]